jgi:hypothetical protein
MGNEILRDTVRGETLARAHIKIPFTTCQSFVSAPSKDELNELPRALLGYARTKIFVDDSGTLEIYHVDRQENLTVRKVGWGKVYV